MKTNKKVLVLGLAIGMVSGLSAVKKHKKMGESSSTIYHDVTRFIHMERKHKDDWFKHIEKFSREKLQMLHKHHDACAALHESKMRSIEKEGGCAPELFETFLHEAIDLHKTHRADWRMLHDRNYEECVKIANEHGEELEKFENSLP